MRAFDAPAVLLPNGKVLCIVGSPSSDGWPGKPCHAYEFDGRNLNPAPDPPNATDIHTDDCRLLLLPTGEVLCSAGNNKIQVYQPDGMPDPAWAPELVNAPARIARGYSFTLQGKLLNGLSQANSFGDDAQMATNFPIVRLTAANGQVYYCRTSHFSTMGVATGAKVLSATVAVPGTVPLGNAQMDVVANGIATSVRVAVDAPGLPPLDCSQYKIALDGANMRLQDAQNMPASNPAQAQQRQDAIYAAQQEVNVAQHAWEECLQGHPPKPGPGYPGPGHPY
jgi:hypothetical protein